MISSLLLGHGIHFPPPPVLLLLFDSSLGRFLADIMLELDIMKNRTTQLQTHCEAEGTPGARMPGYPRGHHGLRPQRHSSERLPGVLDFRRSLLGFSSPL